MSLTALLMKARALHAFSPLHASSSMIKLPAVFGPKPLTPCTTLQAFVPWHAFFPTKILATVGDTVASWLLRAPTLLHPLSALHAPSSTRTLPKTLRPTVRQLWVAVQALGPITLNPTSTPASGCVGEKKPTPAQERNPLQLSSMIVSEGSSLQAILPMQDPVLTVITLPVESATQAEFPLQQSVPQAAVTKVALPVKSFLPSFTTSNIAPVTLASFLILSKRSCAISNDKVCGGSSSLHPKMLLIIFPLSGRASTMETKFAHVPVAPSHNTSSVIRLNIDVVSPGPSRHPICMEAGGMVGLFDVVGACEGNLDGMSEGRVDGRLDGRSDGALD
eukprot:CAMPEP_0198135272 /NCGR_PEP_ID=MMETSP1442-20131203/60503_1 /TAXON_ID= /ORGANISM="Craspedostauros australis, Strain CCMP3328" /LENGTH=333 /DNA_ID=CAMNT_0043796435 /DNA_START=1928 /DNA_END=2926 /DNA_ORIENTATION=+